MAVSISNKDGLLAFDLGKGPTPKAYLSMTNTSETSNVLFKVRTTQPMWYFVRPNQDIIKPGETVDLVFTLTEAECERFLQLHRSGSPESVDKHRFLIQSRSLEENEFNVLSNMSQDSADRHAEVRLDNHFKGAKFLSNECLPLPRPSLFTPIFALQYTRLWEVGSKDDRKLHKLKVQFSYPSGGRGSSQADAQSIELEDERNGSPGLGSLGGLGGLGGIDAPPDSYESCWAELQALKKRFDQIREYTVNLTVDRDNIVNKLEALQQEMATDTGPGGAGNRAGHKDAPRGGQAGTSQTGRSGSGGLYSEAFYILLAALLSFLAGRWVSSQ